MYGNYVYSVVYTVQLRYARHVQSYRCVPFVYYYGVYLLLGFVYYAEIRLHLLVFLSEKICVVGICCGCPPFFNLSGSRLNGL